MVEERLELEAEHRARLIQAGQLLAGVVHEIKNPLAVIQGYAQLLHDRCESEPDQEELASILEEARRVGRLVDHMLAFTRKGTGAVENVDLNQAVNIIVNLTMHAMRQSSTTVVAAMPENPIIVRGSQGTLLQVLMNLLTNARQSLEQGRAAGRGISIRAVVDGSRTNVFVANNGPPIPDEIERHIFDPFFTTKDEGDGTGLGLALCREGLARFGATIDLADNGEEGVCFRVGLLNA